MRYLALCCIVKEENPFIREWIAYHAQRGVEHFYIYDNGSRVPAESVAGEYAGSKLATFIEAPGDAIQLSVYADCLKRYGADNKWIGFIDLDEFLCPHQDDDLRVMLAEFEPYAGLGVNWQVFSSNKHLRRPDLPVLEAYTEAVLYDYCLIKSIVQPRYTLAPAKDPHTFLTKDGTCCVTEEHRPIPPNCPRAVSGRKLVQVNHYRYRSQQDFEDKIKRGRATTTKKHLMRTLEIFYEQTRWEYRPDTSTARFLPAVKKALQEEKLRASRVPWPVEAPFEAVGEAVATCMRNKKYEDAQRILCVASLRHADNPIFWWLRAVCARQAGKLDRAGRFLDQSLRLGELPNAYLELFYLALAKGDFADADVRLRGFEGFVDFFLKGDPEFAQSARNERARLTRLVGAKLKGG